MRKLSLFGSTSVSLALFASLSCAGEDWEIEEGAYFEDQDGPTLGPADDAQPIATITNCDERIHGDPAENCIADSLGGVGQHVEFTDINDCGWIVGIRATDSTLSDAEATLWMPTTAGLTETALGKLGGGSWSYALAISDVVGADCSGDAYIVGSGDNAVPWSKRSVRWFINADVPGAPEDVDVAAGEVVFNGSHAHDVTTAGAVVGTRHQDAYHWDGVASSGMTNIHGPTPPHFSAAFAINGLDEIVGWKPFLPEFLQMGRAVKWASPVAAPVGLQDEELGTAMDINDSGHVVGIERVCGSTAIDEKLPGWLGTDPMAPRYNEDCDDYLQGAWFKDNANPAVLIPAILGPGAWHEAGSPDVPVRLRIDVGGSSQYDVAHNAFGINEYSQVVGQTPTEVGLGWFSGGGGGQPSDYSAFVWTSGGGTEALPALDPLNSWAVAINDYGRAVGASFDANGDVHAVMWRVPSDSDGDGILDEVDPDLTACAGPPCAFDDHHNGGWTSGTADALPKLIEDAIDMTHSWGQGLRLVADNGGLNASFSCLQGSPVPVSGTVSLPLEDDEAIVSCSSFIVEAVVGDVGATFFGADGREATATIAAGNTLAFDNETFEFTAPETNPDTVDVEVDGDVIAVGPGETVDVPIGMGVEDCPEGYNVIEGTPGNDVLVGTEGLDCILGYGGADTIIGGNGRDFIMGGAGDDRLEGRNAQDQLFGETGDDLLIGGNGADGLDGGCGDDILSGDNGPDALEGGPGEDILDGGKGPDTCDGAPC
jgi:Ca2+-binding RTX toxin-like protein